MTSLITYSIIVFIFIFISGCILNLLRQHYIFQLAGIAFLFLYEFIRMVNEISSGSNLSALEIYSSLLPFMAGISACFMSMLLGFWIFPAIRRKFKD